MSLACSECGHRNYKITRNLDVPLELKKFCPACKHHTLHHETK